MRRGTKRLLSSALVLFIIGAAFCIVSLCIGFDASEFRSMADSGELRLVGPSGWREDVEDFVDSVSTEEIDFEKSYTGIKSLDLEVGTADCVLVPASGEEWKVTGSNLPSGFSVKESGSKLKIDCSENKWKFWKFWSWGDSNETKLVIYIPKSQEIEKLDIETGVGEVTMEEGFLKCRSLELDCGVGSSRLSLDILKKADISGGVGEIELTVQGAMEDFDYDLECGVGEIELDGDSQGGLGSERKINNDASKSMDVDCGVGSIKIDFVQG